MDRTQPDKTPQESGVDPRTYFAAERTLLAWVRTGLALMGFGFVVARFGLFLRELAAARGINVPQRSGLSLMIGVTLVLLGVAVNVSAPLQHRRRMQRIEQGEAIRFNPWSIAALLAFALALLGLMIASYLALELSQAAR